MAKQSNATCVQPECCRVSIVHTLLLEDIEKHTQPMDGSDCAMRHAIHSLVCVVVSLALVETSRAVSQDIYPRTSKFTIEQELYLRGA